MILWPSGPGVTYTFFAPNTFLYHSIALFASFTAR
jgi:hypothetical protein